MGKRFKAADSQAVLASKAEWEKIKSDGSWSDRAAFLERVESHLAMNYAEWRGAKKDVHHQEKLLRTIAATPVLFEQHWHARPRIPYPAYHRCAGCGKKLIPTNRYVINGLCIECHAERVNHDPELAEELAALNSYGDKVRGVVDARKIHRR